MIKRTFIKTTAALALVAAFGSAQGQTTAIKFQLDWRFEGPAALFLTPTAKGYFKDAKFDVTVDAGNGVKLNGNVIIATPKLIKENPAAVKAFLLAFTKGAKDVMANPAAAINDVKARDGIINVELETRRLKLAIDTVINSPDARAEGFGQIKGPRLSLMASQVSDAFATKSRVNPDAVWNGSFLPTVAELNILPKR